jgi:hypothetical protein
MTATIPATHVDTIPARLELVFASDDDAPACAGCGVDDDAIAPRAYCFTCDAGWCGDSRCQAQHDQTCQDAAYVAAGL